MFPRVLLPALVICVCFSAPAVAADEQKILEAIDRGIEFLKKQAATNFSAQQKFPAGVDSMVGLALLEGGVSVDHPAVQSILARVRSASYSQSSTYPISLCILFLDHVGDPADVPLIQVLGVRLLAGQSLQGGWGYDCAGVAADEVERLRESLKPEGPTLPKGPRTGPLVIPKMHSAATKYSATLANVTRRGGGDDNSNTQFAIMGLWIARRNGVPVDAGLQFMEQRFLRTQTATGGWGYTEKESSTPSMTCAGLLGLSTGIARRDEKRIEPKTLVRTIPKGADPNDPFFNPPQIEQPETPKKAEAKRAPDGSEPAARRGVLALGGYTGSLGQLIHSGGNAPLGTGDLYFFWSVERVGVIYGLDSIGGVNWYDVGASTLLRTQTPAGSWGWPGEYGGHPIGTSFAILFLRKANLMKDLRANRDNFRELRTGSGNSSPPPNPSTTTTVTPAPPSRTLPDPATNEAAAKAAELVRATDADWAKVLAKLRDGKGDVYTRGLMYAAMRLDGGRKKDAREALAERLTRMTAASLREMLKSDEPELRRAAALACAMKDDAAHIPDLIDRLGDDSPSVWLAAKGGLKSLTRQDFGPAPTASPDDRRRAVEAWKAWYANQKK